MIMPTTASFAVTTLFLSMCVAEKSRETRFLHRPNGRTDQRMDKPSYRDAFLTDASKKNRAWFHIVLVHLYPESTNRHVLIVFWLCFDNVLCFDFILIVFWLCFIAQICCDAAALVTNANEMTLAKRYIDYADYADYTDAVITANTCDKDDDCCCGKKCR